MSIVNAYVEPIVKEAIEKRKAKIAAGGNKVEGDMDLEDTDGDETFLDNLVKQTSGVCFTYYWVFVLFLRTLMV